MNFVLVGRRLWPSTAALAGFRPQEVYQGLGLYETVGCENGKPLLWQVHAARLLHSAGELFGLRPTLPDEGAVCRLLSACGLARGPAAVRVVWFSPRREALAWAARYRVPRRLREQGCRITTAALPPTPVTGHKTTSVGPAQLLHRQALAAGFDGVVFYDQKGQVRETATANIFAVFGREVLTPPAPPLALPGVVRAWCLGYLRELGWEVREASLPLARLLACDGAFLTSSLAGVVPVRAIEDKVLPFSADIFHAFKKGPVPVPGHRHES